MYSAATSQGRVKLNCVKLEDRYTPAFFAVGAEAGGGPRVRVINDSLGVVADFFAYESTFTGGVRVAMGDVTGDGVQDLVTAPGPGGGQLVRIFQGPTFTNQLNSYFSFNSTDRGGLYVAVGDVTGDGVGDVITSGYNTAAGTAQVRMRNRYFDQGVNVVDITAWNLGSTYVPGYSISVYGGAVAVGNPGGEFNSKTVYYDGANQTLSTFDNLDDVRFYNTFNGSYIGYHNYGIISYNRAINQNGVYGYNYAIAPGQVNVSQTDGDLNGVTETTASAAGFGTAFNNGGNVTVIGPSQRVAVRNVAGTPTLLIGSVGANCPVYFYNFGLTNYQTFPAIPGFNGGVWVG